MNNLAAAVYLTAEGLPFMQAGEEMLRSKLKSGVGFEENSYASPDSVNSLKWDTLNDEQYMNVYNYYKGLIAFRKEHAALRLTNAEDVKAHVTPIDGLDANVVAFQIDGDVENEISDGMFIIFNANNSNVELDLPEGAWDVCINGETAGTQVLETITTGKVTVSPISAMVLVKNDNAQAADSPVADSQTVDSQTTETVEGNGLSTPVIALIVILAIIIIAMVVRYISKKRK